MGIVKDGQVKNGRETGIVKGIVKQLIAVGRDENGGEVIEYALVLGLIVVLSIAMIGSVGTKVLGKWTSVNNKM